MSDTSSPNVGEGAVNNDEIKAWGPIRGSATEDSLQALNVNLAMNMTVADPGNSITIEQAVAELI